MSNDAQKNGPTFEKARDLAGEALDQATETIANKLLKGLLRLSGKLTPVAKKGEDAVKSAGAAIAEDFRNTKAEAGAYVDDSVKEGIAIASALGDTAVGAVITVAEMREKGRRDRSIGAETVSAPASKEKIGSNISGKIKNLSTIKRVNDKHMEDFKSILEDCNPAQKELVMKATVNQVLDMEKLQTSLGTNPDKIVGEQTVTALRKVGNIATIKS